MTKLIKINKTTDLTEVFKLDWFKIVHRDNPPLITIIPYHLR